MASFSTTAGALAGSETLAITARAKAMKAAGIHVVPFAAGEPDFDTPQHIQDAGQRAIAEGRTRYGPAAGILPLREAIAARAAATGYAGATADHCLVSTGAKGILYLALGVLLRPGDEVLVPSPYWLSYPKMVEAVGARVVPVPTHATEGFRIDLDAMRAAVTPRTRAILVNSPGNPTGAVQPDDVLRGLAELAREHDLMVVSDEIYEHLTYAPAEFRSFAQIAPHCLDRVLVVNGVSKAYAMTGWRIGWGTGPVEWITRMTRLQSHAFSGPPEICQRAALAALEGPQDAVATMREAFAARRDRIVAGLRAIPGVELSDPSGAFYVLPDIAHYLGRSLEGTVLADTRMLCEHLLESGRVAAVPGVVFDAPRAIRLSYACSTEDIDLGLERLSAFLQQLT